MAELEDIVAEQVVGSNENGVRLDQFGRVHFPLYLPSRNGARKAAKRGLLLVDGQAREPGCVLSEGQHIQLQRDNRPVRRVLPVRLDVIYEDEWLAVVFKPGGMLTNGNAFRTLENALPHNLTPSSAPDALKRLHPVHRLDRATCGMVLVAKTRAAEVSLNRLFQERNVRKGYIAVVTGRLEGTGNVETPIEGRNAFTAWESLEVTRALRTEWVTTVSLVPRTGRTHQLRRHMAEMGHPVLGDTLYGREGEVLRGKGLFLCACSLDFTHPLTCEELRLTTDEPSKYGSLRRREARRWNQHRGDEV